MAKLMLESIQNLHEYAEGCSSYAAEQGPTDFFRRNDLNIELTVDA